MSYFDHRERKKTIQVSTTVHDYFIKASHRLTRERGEYVPIRATLTQWIRDHEEYSQLLDMLSPFVTWTCDQNLETVFVSDSFYRLTGAEPNSLNGTLGDWTRYCHPEDVPKVIANMNDAIERKAPFFYCFYRLKRFDGAWVWMLGRGRTRTVNGKFGGFIGSSFEISDLDSLLAVIDAVASNNDAN